jgi:Rrf2 family protein
MLSQTAEHALRALLYMARQAGGETVPARRIAAATGAPAKYLAKTLQGLANAGLVRGTRGREGGYVLAVPAGSITVGDVLDAFPGMERPTRCLLGDRGCNADHPCVAHDQWVAAQRVAVESLSGIRIEDLLTGAVVLARMEDAALRRAS